MKRNNDDRSWTKADFAKAKPAREALGQDFLDQMEAQRQAALAGAPVVREQTAPDTVRVYRRAGRPREENPRVMQSFRINPRLKAAIQQAGKGVNARAERALMREFLGE